MVKIVKIDLLKVFDGAGRSALLMRVETSVRQRVEASMPATELMSANELALISEKLYLTLAGQELEESLWPLIQSFINEEKNQRYLVKPVALLLEIAVLKILALVSGREVFEQIVESFGLKQSLFLMPTPIISVFGGAWYGDSNLDFRDYLLIPLTKNRTSFEKKLSDASLVYHKLATVLKSAGYDADIGSLGAYAPDLVSTMEALDLLIASINLAGFSPAKDFGLGIDVGAASLYNIEEHNYLFRLSHNYFSSNNLSSLYREWLIKYPIFYLQDVLAPEDKVAWQELTQELREELVLAGAELFADNKNEMRRAVAAGLANTVVLDYQKCSSLTDLFEMVALAKKHHYQVVVAASERETNEDFVADLALASGADFVKFGALARGERSAKYSRLLVIAQLLELSSG